MLSQVSIGRWASLVRTATLVALWVCVATSSGCAAIISSVTSGLAEDLSHAIMNSDDPVTVGEAIPAYLIVVDALVEGSPRNVDLLFAAADLNAAYASAFVKEKDRLKAISSKAFDLASRAACLDVKWTCDIRSMHNDDFESRLAGVTQRDLDSIYGLASNWVTWIQANSDDWNAIADLGRAKSLMSRTYELSPHYKDGQAAMYLGVFELILPPAYGGRPDEGRKYLEFAIDSSDGRNLYAQVLFAEYYTRMVFDQELHDSTLKHVLGADPVAEGLTLQNRIAQIRARELLEGSSDYF